VTLIVRTLFGQMLGWSVVIKVIGCMSIARERRRITIEIIVRSVIQLYR